MYEYKFVRIGMGFLSGKPKRDYREVIEQQAREGWRFVQMFAPGVGAYGSARYFEIIFERRLG